MSATTKYVEEIFADVKTEYGQPMEIVQRVAVLLLAEMGDYIPTALDLGAGAGRHALPLARAGFSVTAIDSRDCDIDPLNGTANKEELALRGIVADIRAWRIPKEYDLVVSTFALHYVSRECGLRLVTDIQSKTLSGGYNVIAGFVGGGDLFDLDSARERLWFSPMELLNFYQGWEILDYSEHQTRCRKCKPDASPMFNAAVHILARKPR